MDEILRSNLEQGEKILWDSHPEAFKTLDRTHKQAFTKKLLITLITTTVLLGLYIFGLGHTEPLIVGVTVIIALYICASTHMTAWQLKKARYLLTDRRIIVMNNDFTFAHYHEIPMAFFRKDSDGHTSLVCGEYAIKLAPHKWRGYSAAGVRFDSDSKLCDSLILYAIPDPEKVRNILKPYLTVN
ncbi:MAG: hypothetical protein E7442_02610 [Ruminococcaceae bacterium]|nr:hypothetical protein [Oscillospiraceae bacterium]